MTVPRLRAIKLLELPAFMAEVRERIARGAPLAPLSETRARAWMKNPHASGEDVVLLCASIDEQYAGYLGLVPARVVVNGEARRMSWFSTFYVPEHYRSSGIGGMLLMRALSLGQTLAVSSPSEEAARTFRAVGFTELSPARVLRLDVPRSNLLAMRLRGVQRVLRRAAKRLGAPESLDGAVRALNRPVARLAHRTLKAAIRQSAPGFHSEPAFVLPQGQTRCEQSALGADLFVRDAAVVNWMLRHPWVAVERDQDTPRYHFDDFRERQEFRLLRIVDGSRREDLGFVVVRLAQRRGVRELQVLDQRVDGSDAAGRVAVAALEEAARFLADRVVLPDACGTWLKSQTRMPALSLFAPDVRTFLLRPGPREREHASALLSLRPRYEDGDTAFA